MILILTVSLKPDPALVSGPCTLIEGTSTSESQGGKQVLVVFNVHNIEKKGEMNCSDDYAKYSTSKMAEMVSLNDKQVRVKSCK